MLSPRRGRDGGNATQRGVGPKAETSERDRVWRKEQLSKRALITSAVEASKDGAPKETASDDMRKTIALRGATF